jgi:uncharacterized membrane protein
MTESITKERLATFSDGIFAVIITIMVLQLRLPAHATFGSLFDQWPTALSYAVSYLLIVIMWINHHFLWSFAKHSTPRLILWNFMHMLTASLVPFATAWVAAERIAAVPVFVYAAVIVLVNLSYHAFALEVMHGPNRRRALTRSTVTLVLFSSAMLLSLALPLLAFALVTCVLVTYARPD